MFFPPPTAPRTFVEEDPIQPLCRLPQLSQKMIVIVIIGRAGFAKSEKSELFRVNEIAAPSR